MLLVGDQTPASRLPPERLGSVLQTLAVLVLAAARREAVTAEGVLSTERGGRRGGATRHTAVSQAEAGVLSAIPMMSPR